VCGICACDICVCARCVYVCVVVVVVWVSFWWDGDGVLLACFLSVFWFFVWRCFLLAFFVGIGRDSVF